MLSRNILRHPNLKEFPNSLGSHGRRVDELRAILARERPIERRVVQRARPRIAGKYSARDRIQHARRRDIVAEARLGRLVDVQEVGVVVPGPGVQHRGVGVGVGDKAGPVLADGLVHGRRAGPALQPDAQRRRLGRDARLEEPEEELLLVRLESGGREGEIAAVGLDTRSGLADTGLELFVSRHLPVRK